ncbi:hypothetical protein NO1_2256, partial [Candidatus Termititenax aidoneus]
GLRRAASAAYNIPAEAARVAL